MQLRIHLPMIILRHRLRLTVRVFDLQPPLAAVRTTAVLAFELFVAVQGHDQPPGDLGRLEGFVGLEGAVDVHQRRPPILDPIAFEHIPEGIVADGLRPADQPLPAPAGGLGLQL